VLHQSPGSESLSLGHVPRKAYYGWSGDYVGASRFRRILVVFPELAINQPPAEFPLPHIRRVNQNAMELNLGGRADVVISCWF
jgi:hypothetical protein